MNTFIIVALLALFAYWFIREKQTKVDRAHSKHNKFAQWGIRLLLPVMVLLLIAQLLGFITLSLPFPAETTLRLTIVGHVLFWIAVPLSIWARESMGGAWTHAADLQVTSKHLVSEGPFRFVRHPIYTFLLLLFIGVELIVASWLIVLAVPLFVFFYWQAKKEENLLLEMFGEEYRRHQHLTGMFVPFV